MTPGTARTGNGLRRRGIAPPVPSWQDAIEEAPGGARLLLDVTPGARDERFPDGFEPWRGRIGARVKAQAQDGAANAALIRLLAAFFRHPTARVHVESGATDRRKAVRVMGLDRAAVVVALEPQFQEAEAE
jgi:uncharacterized protein (TIGR00251 family)